MRKTILSLIVLCFLLPVGLMAEGHDHNDEYRVTYFHPQEEVMQYHIQSSLRAQTPWQSFLQSYPSWKVLFNERTGMPHRAFGSPIAVSGPTPEAMALSFFENNLEGYNVPLEELKFVSVIESNAYYRVLFHQEHDGFFVKDARADFKITKEGSLVLFGLEIHNNIELSTDPELTESALVNAAINGMSHVQDTEIKGYAILPMPAGGKYEYRKILELDILTEEEGVPGRFQTYVDAIDGTVLFRVNRIHTASATGIINVRSDVRTGRVFEPETDNPLPRLDAIIDGLARTTDADGDIDFSITSPVSATFFLKGDWVDVRDNGVTPSYVTTLDSLTDTVNLTSAFSVEGRSAYFHTDLIHNHMKGYLPNFGGLDIPLTCNIEITPHQCNAFYDGSSINFYTAGAGCYSLAQLKDVVYHEYGHGINGRYYSSQGLFGMGSGGMNEGYADVWAFTITEDAILAQGNDPNDTSSVIRRYDQGPKIYPQDLIGQVHNDGEIIAGSVWDTYLYSGLSMDSLTAIWSQAFIEAADGIDGTEGTIYRDVLIDMLFADDVPANGGDNDITNGTPNSSAILEGFNDHGISLLGISDLTHVPVETAAINTDITLSADVNVEYASYFGQVTAHYQVNGTGPWMTTPLVLTSGITYEGQIPAQPSGTILSYYVTLDDVNGLEAISQPFRVDEIDPVDRNLPYFVMVGFNQLAIEDFDTQQGNWLEGLPGDQATTGQWIIDVPTPSYSGNGTEVQTGSQHTPGGIACAVTGNAPSPNDGIGVNDIDGGQTTLQTPDFDLSNYTDPAISYYRWYTNSAGATPGQDFWEVYISNDGSTWVQIEDSRTTDASWRRNVVRVSDYVTPTATVSIQFIASDYDPGSLVEAAVDDLEIWDLSGVGIEEEQFASLNLYPNPVSDVLTIDFELQTIANVSYQVIDLTGRVVISNAGSEMSTGSQSIVVKTDQLAAGAYQFVIQMDGASTTKSFVKN